MICVIGGGISGLAFSHYCTKNQYPVKVFDAGRRDACICTHHADPELNIEAGAHTLYNSYQHIIGIIEDYQLQNQVIPKGKLRFAKYDGQLKSLTNGLHWLEIAAHLPRLFNSQKTGKTVSEYYSDILGRQNYQDLFSHAFQAVLCQPADNYPAELLFRKRQRNKTYTRSFTLRTGIEGLLDTIAGNALIDLHPDARVQAISREDTLFRIDDGEHPTHVPFICLACPPGPAAELTRGFDPTLATMLSDIATVHVDSVLIRTGKEQSATRKNIIGIRQPFFSALYSEGIEHSYWLFHFEGLKYAIEKKLLVISKVTGVPKPDLSLVLQRTAKMPSVKTGQLKLLKEIDHYIKDKPVFISSNYMQGLALEDCCERAKKESQRFIEMAGRWK